MHDVYGIEVCGIREEADTSNIHQILKKMFPTWNIHRTYCKDFGADQGFMVTIQRDPEPPDQQWEKV